MGFVKDKIQGVSQGALEVVVWGREWVENTRGEAVQDGKRRSRYMWLLCGGVVDEGV